VALAAGLSQQSVSEGVRPTQGPSPGPRARRGGQLLHPQRPGAVPGLAVAAVPGFRWGGHEAGGRQTVCVEAVAAAGSAGVVLALHLG
jgi:hypothetical protein